MNMCATLKCRTISNKPKVKAIALKTILTQAWPHVKLDQDHSSLLVYRKEKKISFIHVNRKIVQT